ncbi:ATP-binding cassette domain-containing protein [Mycoplasmopsis felifaucium]|uniref:ATP-binding cassette domain-containing protein n=1 Tax=Mycoplasmopsis felifaucium TaxID=35768 RepID=A0ABZ2RQM3_9BACT
MKIKFSNVDIKYNGDFLLKDINLEFSPGKLYGLYGKSGSGKTTLMKSIVDKHLIDKGSIFIDDFETKEIPVKQFNKVKSNFSFLFQETALLDNLDVYDNIKLKLNLTYKNWFYRMFRILDKNQKKQLNEILHNIGISEKIYTPIKFLSGGEKQRVEIASLLFEPKKIVLADEPTTGLDTKNSKHIFKLLKEYAIKNNAVVICSIHDIENSIEFIDESYYIKGKKVITNKSIKSLSEEEINNIYE